MSNIDAPRGSVENSWIVEVFHNQNSVNIKIESGQTLRDVSAEILYRAKLADGDYALHEFLCNGQLQVLLFNVGEPIKCVSFLFCLWNLLSLHNRVLI